MYRYVIRPDNKEDAIVAALDSGSAHMLAAAPPAFRRAPDWPQRALDQREVVTEGMEGLLAPSTPSCMTTSTRRARRRCRTWCRRWST
ncbi:MAG: hypothetical protein WA862_06715 [Solirubrobacterales bacterium]